MRWMIDLEPFAWFVETGSTKTNQFFQDEAQAFAYCKTDASWYVITLYPRRLR